MAIRFELAMFASPLSDQVLRYAAARDPTVLPLVQRALSIPMKRFDRPQLTFLALDEIQAILDAQIRQHGAASVTA